MDKQVELVEKLLQNGADVRVKDEVTISKKFHSVYICTNWALPV